MNRSRCIIALESTLTAHCLPSRFCSILIFGVLQGFRLLKVTALFAEKQRNECLHYLKKKKDKRVKTYDCTKVCTHLQAIFGLHLLQLFLSQWFFILFGESRTFRKQQRQTQGCNLTLGKSTAFTTRAGSLLFHESMQRKKRYSPLCGCVSL